MPKGRPVALLVVSGEDRAQLETWSRRPKTAQALAIRSRLVLLSAEGKSNTAIAATLSVTLQTVGKWRRRYLELGLDGLVDEPRPGSRLAGQKTTLPLTLHPTSASWLPTSLVPSGSCPLIQFLQCSPCVSKRTVALD
jgi:hypothetical protein